MRGLVLDRRVQPIKNLTSVGAVNYNVSSTTFGAANFTLFDVAAGGDGYGGRAYRRVTVNGPFAPPSASLDMVSYGPSNFGISSLGMAIPVTVGRPYSFAIPVRSTIAQKVKGQAQGITASAGGNAKYGPELTLVPNVWTLVPVENWVPTGATVGLRPDVDTGSAPLAWSATDKFEVGRPFIFEGDTLPLGLVADGTVPGWQWLGAAGLSESVGRPYMLEAVAGAPGLILDGTALPSSDTSTLLGQCDAGATGGRTLYAVLDVFDTVGTVTALRWGAAVAGQTRMLSNWSPTGVSSAYNNSSDAATTASLVGARTVGRHVQVMGAAEALASVFLMLDGTAAVPPAIPAPTPFADQTVRAMRSLAGVKPFYIAAYAGEHSVETQKRVTAYLARRFGSPIPAGY